MYFFGNFKRKIALKKIVKNHLKLKINQNNFFKNVPLIFLNFKIIISIFLKIISRIFRRQFSA